MKRAERAVIEALQRERDAALARVRELEEYLHARTERAEDWQMAELMPQLVWSADAGGRVDYCNRRHLEYQGIFRRPDGAWDWAPMLHPEDRGRTVTGWQEALAAGETYEIEHRLRRRGGAYGWHLSRAVPVRDTGGRIVRWFGTATDIDDLKQAEMARSESERQYRAFFDNAAVGMVEMDLEGRFLRVNEEFCRICGYSDDEVLQMDMAQLTHPDDRELDRHVFLAFQEKRTATYEIEKRYRRKDGEVAWIQVSAGMIQEENGRPRRLAAVVRDITRQKQEEAARKAVEESLLAAQSAAEEASRAKSEFLASLSHEIRTPMTVFLAALEFLRQQEQLPEHNELLEMAEKSAHRLRALIEDILDFSRIEARRVEIAEEPFPLREIVQNAAELLNPSAQGKQVRLAVDIAGDVPQQVVGDANRISQVLINLIGNAVKFTQEGEVQVVVRTGKEGIVFSVADTGPGIPEDKQAMLFDSFTQLDSSSTRRHGGTGLGLAISKGLVELMGGAIWLRSLPGIGSIFSFFLPLRSPDGDVLPRPDAEAREAKPSGRESARILVAEDEPMVREMIRKILTQRSYEVEAAETGREAIARWQEKEYDLILMDMQMPEVDGVEATRTIRRLEREAGRKSTCIVALTAHARREVQQECLEAGMDTYLTKPISNQTLLTAIDDCLAR